MAWVASAVSLASEVAKSYFFALLADVARKISGSAAIFSSKAISVARFRDELSRPVC